jgi:hypothetical protein
MAAVSPGVTSAASLLTVTISVNNKQTERRSKERKKKKQKKKKENKGKNGCFTRTHTEAY